MCASASLLPVRCAQHWDYMGAYEGWADKDSDKLKSKGQGCGVGERRNFAAGEL